MLYNVTSDWIKIAETTGTVQNTSPAYTLEMSNSGTPDSGILIYPLNKASFDGQEIYLRVVDGAAARARVVPFALDRKGGGGGNIVNGTLVLGSTSSTVDGAIWIDMED